MKFYEYMAKKAFSDCGITVPKGRVVNSPAGAAEACEEIGECVLKSQVLAGGRGKAGGILFASTPREAEERARELLGKEIRGHVVTKLLVEQKLGIHKELYLSVTVDPRRRCPVVMASAMGGVNIEEVPEDQILTQHVDIEWGYRGYMARDLARRLGLGGEHARRFAGVAERLYGIFRAYDAELCEINPLVISGDDVVAADGRLNVDDDALFRHQDLEVTDEGTELEKKVKALGLSYVQLDGDIAVMANGAGITMATLDVINMYGGRPANFLDAGGGAGVEPTARAIEVLLSTGPRAILINIFGGITRCDDVANALVQVKRSRGIPVPLVIRLVGTNEEKGLEILRQEGIDAFRDMGEAAAKVVELARAGGGN